MQPRAGTVAVRGTLAMLRQSVQPGPAERIADLFGAADALALLRRAEAGRADVDELAAADWTIEARILSALGRVGLAAAPDTLLASLSGGQRTRAGLAAAVFAEPDFLLFDEPTNNLDADGRAAVIALLGGWRAGAIVVSHDRELLEAMDAIVELTSLGATRYGGSWSRYRARKAEELAAAEHMLADAEKQLAAVDRQAQATAERKARKDAAGRRKGARGDMPRILIGMRKDRAEDTGGGNARLAERQRAAAGVAAEAARARIEILQPLTLTLPATGLAADRMLVVLDRVTSGYDPDRPILRDLSLTIRGPERIAVTGANGAGKTTLLALIAGALPPSAGTVRVTARCALLDQQAGLLDRSAAILANFARINGAADENGCRAALARFGFRADAALQIVGTLSGGQLLRAALACVLGGPQPPHLLLLDEPTNHLDIAAIEAVEAGLRGYDGALLVVSHDAAFLEAIGVTRRVAIGAPDEAQIIDDARNCYPLP